MSLEDENTMGAYWLLAYLRQLVVTGDWAFFDILCTLSMTISNNGRHRVPCQGEVPNNDNESIRLTTLFPTQGDSCLLLDVWHDRGQVTKGKCYSLCQPSPKLGSYGQIDQEPRRDR